MYNWAGYHQLINVIRATGLKVQAVLSFHACGQNVNDTAQIPLPSWVLQCGEQDPDLFFTDRPRDGGLGQRNREYVSIWADDAPGVLCGRTPMQCYEEFMTSFRDNFQQDLGTCIEEVVLGAGPCGELRYPSYSEPNGWRFPGIGEFQCYDRRALASLAQAAREAGHPQWGYGGPHDAGDYNSTPEETGFFSYEGSWDSPYGRFFLAWYSGCLLRHGERMLAMASQVFAGQLGRRLSCQHSHGAVDSSSGSEASAAMTMLADMQAARRTGGSTSPVECTGALPTVPQHAPMLWSAQPQSTNSHCGSLRSTITSYGANLNALSTAPAAVQALHGVASMAPSDGALMDLMDDESAAPAGGSGLPHTGTTPPAHSSAEALLGGLPMRPPSMTLVAGTSTAAAAPGGAPGAGMGRFTSSSTIAESTMDTTALGMMRAEAGQSQGGLICNSMSSLSTEGVGVHAGQAAFSTPFVDVGTLIRDVGDDNASDMGGSCMTPDTLGVEEGEEGAARAAAAAAGSNAFAVATAMAAAAAQALYTDGDARPRSSLDASTPHARAREGKITLALKIAGIHWWFRSRSHAAELTAGYYNTATHDGYGPILELCQRHHAALILTCVEMCDGQHPVAAMCGPEGLLKQIRGLATRTQVALSGENALPIFLMDGVDTVALDRILFNTRAWYGPSALLQTVRSHQPATPQPTWQAAGNPHPYYHGAMPRNSSQVPTVGSAPSSVLPSPSGHGPRGGAHWGGSAGGQHSHSLGSIMSIGRSLSDAGKLVGLGRPGDQHGVAASGLRTDSYADIVEPLPAMRSFTFLRLAPELLQPSYQAPWLRFMCRMQQGGYAPC